VPETGSAAAELGLSWRLALGLGALPGILLAPFKTRSRVDRAPEQPRPGTPDVEVPMVNPIGERSDQARQAAPTTLLQALQMRKYWGKLVGTVAG
jgi:hypothetical protein